MGDTGYQPYCEKCGAPVVWCTCLDDVDWSLEMRSHLGRVRFEQQVKELRAELARRDEIIARLKEDAERLADGMIISPENEGDFCSYCGGMEHVDDCPITLHRALMKELEESENE